MISIAAVLSLHVEQDLWLHNLLLASRIEKVLRLHNRYHMISGYGASHKLWHDANYLQLHSINMEKMGYTTRISIYKYDPYSRKNVALTI